MRLFFSALLSIAYPITSARVLKLDKGLRKSAKWSAYLKNASRSKAGVQQRFFTTRPLCKRLFPQISPIKTANFR